MPLAQNPAFFTMQGRLGFGKRQYLAMGEKQ
jgi:hypothetical protein